MKKLFIIILFILLIFVFLIIKYIPIKKEKHKTRYDLYQEKYPNKEYEQIITEVKIGLDKPFYTNPLESKNLHTRYILVNKYNYLNKDYIPKDLVNINDKVKLVKEAQVNFDALVTDAKKENLYIFGFSGYRNYEYQNKLYNRYVSIDGKEKADTYSARPGYSEHQTGLAIDVSNNKLSYDEFDKTPEFSWMIENAYKYGFILRYPKNKEYITGYSYEPWHYRYVGIEISSYIQKKNITFDEYYVKFIL